MLFSQRLLCELPSPLTCMSNLLSNHSSCAVKMWLNLQTVLLICIESCLVKWTKVVCFSMLYGLPKVQKTFLTAGITVCAGTDCIVVNTSIILRADIPKLTLVQRNPHEGVAASVHTPHLM